MISLTCPTCREEYPCTGGVMAKVYEPGGPPTAVYSRAVSWPMLCEAPTAMRIIGIACSRECAELVELAFAIAKNGKSDA